MHWLPIAVRELRLAARKRSSFWLRVAAAATGILIGAAFFFLSEVKGVRAAEIGAVLFHVLAWLCLAATLSAGLFFTSDSLSEEKREGTLGLLFLTELRGFDVVVGKLFATSLRGFYALLAVLPILAITVLMGGIAGAQYWKSALALVNCLFLSLAAGMVISALSRDSQKALAATLLLLLILSLGGLLADGLVAHARGRRFQPAWSLASPGYVLAAAAAWGRSAFWTGLCITHGLAWAMFGLACALLPHTWQDRKSTRSVAGQGWVHALKYGRGNRRAKVRRKLLERHPITWLGCRERWQKWALWAMAVLAGGGFAAVLLSEAPREVWIVWIYIGGLFTLILYLWAASQACRFLGEARRSGFLELLLVTPVAERQIARGQLQAFLRMFGLPILLLLGAYVAGATLSQLAFQRLATQTQAAAAKAAAAAAVAAATNQNAALGVSNQSLVLASNQRVIVRSPGKVIVATSTSVQTNVAGTNTTMTTTSTATIGGPSSPVGPQSMSRGQQAGMAAGAAVVAAVRTAANLLAICWFGMWMGMTSRSANLAALKTILFVQVIPWFVIAMGSSALMGVLMVGMLGRGRTPQSDWIAWWPLLSAAFGGTLAVGKDVVFVLWSRNKLYSNLRQEASHSPGQPRFAISTPTPPPLLPANP